MGRGDGAFDITVTGVSNPGSGDVEDWTVSMDLVPRPCGIIVTVEGSVTDGQHGDGSANNGVFSVEDVVVTI